MKLPWGIVAVIVASAVAQNVTQQQELQRAVQLIGTMPECAVSWFGKSLERSMYLLLSMYSDHVSCKQLQHLAYPEPMSILPQVAQIRRRRPESKHALWIAAQFANS